MSARGGGAGGGCFGVILVLVVIGLIIEYIVWITSVLAAAAVIALAVFVGRRWAQARSVRRAEQRERNRALLTRAQHQHEAFQRGEAGGLYGQYPPAIYPDVPGLGRTGRQAPGPPGTR